ncbi:PRTRC system ThiF family protein [Thalassotalea piscium]|uniref:PRTRC genetic system ThiF family protein n=1 Tax=Thalassotalea piscium TaxID=1230533 RepID=A0A7X0NGP6_9GAMM|nr:PRTRC system ThiF family protein [Thalassotalea piscium]MBB6543142.1 PRTRC genetic system ThiF family protein [Thalassotalea piscium]
MKFTIPNDWVNRPINISLVGAGGTGSALLTDLFQMSFLLNELSQQQVYFNVTVYDDDDVSFTNVGKQSFWNNDVGLNKAETLIDRFNSYGGLNWKAINKKFDPKKFDPNKIDLLITCTDSAQFRACLGKTNQCDNHPLLWLDTGNCNHSGQVVLGYLGQSIFTLPNVYQLYPELSKIRDKPSDSCSHHEALSKQDWGINKKVALEASGLIWQLIRHGALERHGSFINLKDGYTTPLPIDPIHWSMLGFDSGQVRVCD